MARYIDADAFLDRMKKTPRYFDVKFDIEQEPTADAVKKSEVDRLEYTLLGVMHSVDKWLEGDELEQDEVNRAATMREKTLQIIENAKTEVAMEIFEDIDRVVEKYSMGDIEYPEFVDIIAELKKKYTEGTK